MTKRIASLALALFLAMSSGSASQAAGKLTAIESSGSVQETADRIVAMLNEKGIAVAARINHAAAARANGLTLADTEVILFGNPKLGTPLMAANPEIAIDLPMRMLVWQGADGKVMVGYAPPAELLESHGLADRQEALQVMTKVLGDIAEGAAAAK